MQLRLVKVGVGCWVDAFPPHLLLLLFALFPTPFLIYPFFFLLLSSFSCSEHVSGVYRGEAGIFSAMQPGTMLIDASTIDPMLAKELAVEAAEKNATMVDAPVSGGVGGAEAGTLTFMVGGTTDAYNRACTVLTHMGKNLVHCGDNGTGQVAKICNNMLLAITMIGTSETMNLGVRYAA